MAYNTWGKTGAVAAASSITADVLDGRLPWSHAFHHVRHIPDWHDLGLE